MTILPLISTSFIVISAILVAYGWALIKKGKREAHIKTMKWASVFASMFFILYISRIVFIGSSLFGGPAELEKYYRIFLFFHILLATLVAIGGIWTIWLGLKGNFSKHKRIGPWTAATWLIVACTGVTTYLLLYVLYPAKESPSLMKTIFGW